MTSSNQVNSIGDLLAFQGSRPDLFCFRGQEDSEWKLIPGLYRSYFTAGGCTAQDAQWIGELERDIYREFDDKGRRLTSVAENDGFGPWHQLFYAQHYGVPTRLLDWTTSILAAAFFAVDRQPAKDGIVWCLNLTALPTVAYLGRPAASGGVRLEAIIAAFARERVPFFQTRTQRLESTAEGALIVVQPPTLHERLRNQDGLFSLYLSTLETPLVWDHGEEFQAIGRKTGTTVLTSLIIPAARKAVIRRELRQSQIHAFSIFPDLDGLGAYLSTKREESVATRVLTRGPGNHR